MYSKSDTIEIMISDEQMKLKKKLIHLKIDIKII